MSMAVVVILLTHIHTHTHMHTQKTGGNPPHTSNLPAIFAVDRLRADTHTKEYGKSHEKADTQESVAVNLCFRLVPSSNPL